MRVLLVDDDVMHLLILRRIFETSKDIVVTAQNGKEALKALKNNPHFHVILTDIQMPEMDGVELLAKVKSDGKINKIPVVGFTSGDIRYYQKKSPIPFDSLVAKPLNFSELHLLAREKALTDVN